jgi:hypothetical protein
MLTDWIRKLVALASPVAAWILPPISLMKLSAFGPHGPRVSTLTGTKRNLSDRLAYLALFALSASSATFPAALDAV